MAIDYLDFDLEIGRGDGRTYPLAVLHSPAGNVRGHFDLALGQLELANRLLALQNGQVALDIFGEVVEAPAVVVQTPSPATNQPTAGRAVQPKPVHTPPTMPILFEWCHVPAGDFLMGSNDQHSDEKPQHTVNLPDFYIAKTPVTNTQYKRFVDEQGYQAPSHWQQGQIPKDKEHHPVVNVSWRDDAAFCAWANVQLPSEAQWEKAARGTDGRLYPWGNQPPTEQLCNFSGSQIGDTTPVNNYPDGASPYGCLDMAGNVREWTSSLYHDYPYKSTYERENLEAAAPVETGA